MATQQVNGSAVTVTSTRNGGGAVVNAGSSTLVDNVSLGLVYPRTGTGPVDGTNTDEALSAGTFAFNSRGPVAKKVTTSLSGVSNTVLRSGADQPQLIRSIHKLEVLTTRRVATAIRAGYWNIYSGVFSPAPTVATDTLATDNAATPTRANPGQLAYMTGAKNPVQDDYAAKTG
jgi:hypothetical protein